MDPITQGTMAITTALSGVVTILVAVALVLMNNEPKKATIVKLVIAELALWLIGAGAIATAWAIAKM